MKVSLTEAQRKMLATITEKGYAFVGAGNIATARVLERKGLVVFGDDWKVRHYATRTIRTEDGKKVAAGSRVFNYYDMKAGIISSPIDKEGWFDVTHDDGSTALLNGERICTIPFARMKGWLSNQTCMWVKCQEAARVSNDYGHWCHKHFEVGSRIEEELQNH